MQLPNYSYVKPDPTDSIFGDETWISIGGASQIWEHRVSYDDDEEDRLWFIVHKIADLERASWLYLAKWKNYDDPIYRSAANLMDDRFDGDRHAYEVWKSSRSHVSSADYEKIVESPRRRDRPGMPYYLRYSAAYPFGIYDAKKKAHSIFFWNEYEAGHGSKDTASRWYKYLRGLEARPFLVIWADNCTSQNKSWILVRFWAEMVRLFVLLSLIGGRFLEIPT